MRRLLFILAFPIVAAAGGCANIYGLGDYTTGDPPAPASGSGDAPAADLGSGHPASADVQPACKTSADCGSGAVCVRPNGRCAPLASAECPRTFGDPTKDGAVVVGAIVDEPLEQAVALAVEEIADAAGPRPLVLVACDPTRAVGAAHHLVDDLRVPAIVGPIAAEDVLDVTQQVSAKGGTLVMTPSSLASAISNLADDDLTWRAVPSDAQRANLVIQQMSALEDVLRTTRSLTTVKLGIVHRTDALGTSARDAISGKLIINGRFINDAANAANVSIDAYATAADESAQAAIVTRYASAFKPDMIFVTAPEQVGSVLVPLEQALTAARAVNRPYWVLSEAAKTKALLDAVGTPGMPADLRRRIRGIGATSDPQSAPVFAAFKSRFAAKYGAAPPSVATAAAYDATWAVAYALAATSNGAPSGASVARGLRALGVGGAMTVGPTDAAQGMQSVATGKSVSLRGTNTLLQWDAKGDIAGGTVEAWCIGAAGGAPAFGSSGLTMDVQTQVVGGAFVQCQ